MDRKKMVPEANTLEASIELKGAHLKKLTIRNFRCIGKEGISIDLDRIVVLVGPNNVGKSTILRAYTYVMEHSKINQDDFPKGVFDSDNPPNIELETWLGDEMPGEEWRIKEDLSGRLYVREQWIWGEDCSPKRKGWSNNDNDWSDNVPWGAPNIAQSYRPKPHRVEAFSAPEQQAMRVAELLTELIKEKAFGGDIPDEENIIYELQKTYQKIHNALLKDTEASVKQIETEIASTISSIFPDYQVKFEVSPTSNLEKITELLFTNPKIQIGPNNGHLSRIQDQGSGTQRTLLWAALKLLAEKGKSAKKSVKKGSPKKTGENNCEYSVRQNILLIDEPEICLHPSAVRDACKTLYDLAESNTNWQVMVTTHSPVFIDIARDHTTVVRVQREESGVISSTTIFRPDKVTLSADEKESLKLLNLWDPYIAEFFFGGKTILVEGDTEYTIFKNIIENNKQRFKHVHIIRARGKAILVPLIKILNHFGEPYSVLHDADTPKTKAGDKVNSMWTENQKIKDAVSLAPHGLKIRLVAAIKDFEYAILGTEASSRRDKPYTMYEKLKNSTEHTEKASKILDALINHENELPVGFLEWNILDNLKAAVEELPG